MTLPPMTLAADGEIAAPKLTQFLADQAGEDAGKQALAGVIRTFARAAIPLAARLGQGRLPGDPTAIVGTNESGDKQKALDMAAHDYLIEALREVSVARVLSEESEEVIALDPEGLFDVAMDPIDGSGSIGIGAPLGALFCVFPAGESFLRPGREVIAAGYVSFGHSVDMGFSMGQGVAIATLDQASGQFYVDDQGVSIKEETSVVAFNASNIRRWTPPLQYYAEDLLRGPEGARGREFNMRWIAAAVGDVHRVLRSGGMFLYPADRRPGYEEGYLRLAYEAFPIAYLMEQAGGAASDGFTPILDLVPGHLHDRVPLFFGSKDEVAALEGYLSK
ncbi:class 1 fructose-bisphosphatase [Marinovum algicola]|jgi:fructose-1,6-bisphosphatase I|uniref:class 1 fructose-bisphosphatase n=1 Tax=Marinovum algicola TaxID=42444 RepID=UPI0024B99F8D|nr:class 1 fructose-bisphosphatase [Marinovum algicola]